MSISVSIRGVAASVLAAASFLAFAMAGCTADPHPDDRSQAEQGLGFAPRQVAAKGKKPRRPTAHHRLVVKFVDQLRVRGTSSGDVLSDVAGDQRGTTAALTQLSRAHGMRFSPLIKLPQSRLDRLEARAARASGRGQPDLGGIFVVQVPEERMQAAADALHASPLTEFVYFEELGPPPPDVCEDVAPFTPDYFSFQSYHGPNPGMDVTTAWTMGPMRGAGVRIADCEYGYVATHEDLCGVILEPGQTPHPDVAANGWDEHGTAVLGQLVSADNGYGCTGIVPDAQAYFFPEWTLEEGFRRHTAIANAIAAMDPGDVVLLEMQAGGATGYGPAELDPVVWSIVKSGTDAGVIVVAAAGNGSQNLDAPEYAEYRSRGDSGAIIVGAGSPDTNHDQLSFSTYGSRVNVQGWGSSVFTLGYGGYAEHGGDKNQRYSGSFNGTSSASPFVAAAAVALQGFAESWLGRRLSPLEMRDLLVSTGVPQGSGGHIGPFPDLVAAANAIMASAASCGDNVCGPQEDCVSCAADCGACACGDGVCNGSEDCATCAADCGACATCGDGVCNGSEDCATCAADCGACEWCGDGVCNGSEDCATCAADCGACEWCGDGVCNGSEDCSSCSQDCGPCAGCVPQGCEQAPSVTIPYVQDGVMDNCVFFNGPSSYMNSWSMSVVEMNGVDVANGWRSSASYPAACNGGYYLRMIGSLPWSHVEVH